MTYVNLHFDLNHNVKHFEEIITKFILALKMLRFEHNFDEKSGINAIFVLVSPRVK